MEPKKLLQSILDISVQLRPKIHNIGSVQKSVGAEKQLRQFGIIYQIMPRCMQLNEAAAARRTSLREEAPQGPHASRSRCGNFQDDQSKKWSATPTTMFAMTDYYGDAIFQSYLSPFAGNSNFKKRYTHRAKILKDISNFNFLTIILITIFDF